MSLIVTTPYNVTAALEAEARSLAEAYNGEYIPRERSSLARLRRRYPGRPIIVAGANGLEWHSPDGEEPFFFHPSMSLVRAKRLAAGERDAMLDAAGLTPGDSVVDCTAGLGSDAIVFSFAGGAETKVTAVESQFPLYLVVAEGLKRYNSGWEEFTQAMRRVEMIHANHTDYLRSLPDRSRDIVYFDPMFRTPEAASSNLSPLRALANSGSITAEAVEEARRVARKAVVMKERGGSREWERLGFHPAGKPHSSVAYGVIQIER